MAKSKNPVVRYQFTFADGTVITWYPIDGKKDQYEVGIRVKTVYGFKSSGRHYIGHPSASSSAHILRWFRKGNPDLK